MIRSSALFLLTRRLLAISFCYPDSDLQATYSPLSGSHVIVLFFVVGGGVGRRKEKREAGRKACIALVHAVINSRFLGGKWSNGVRG